MQSRRQAAQSTLLAQRALLKRLTDRLHELNQQDLDWPSDASQCEDLLSEDELPAPAPASPVLDKQIPPHTEDTQNGLRNRFHARNPVSQDTTTPFPTSPNEADTAALLESNSTTQADITSALIAMASQLKSNSLLFSQTLEADKTAMTQASEALDMNADGMATAGKRMGLLRRMSEGQGWWGRMMLYAWIGGLWVGAVGLVFVGPKFRF